MTLRLAPYNDAMRLGQGFNSYTHELCIDQAVKVKQRKSVVSKGETSQVSQTCQTFAYQILTKCNQGRFVLGSFCGETQRCR